MWGPGLGTDNKEQKENTSVTRILGYTSAMPAKLEKLKIQNTQAQLYKWVAIDNRYFLTAFIPTNALDYSNVEISRLDKKTCSCINFVCKRKTKRKYSKFFNEIFYRTKIIFTSENI